MFWSIVRHMVIEPLAPPRKSSCLNHLGEIFKPIYSFTVILILLSMGHVLQVSWLSHWKKYVITFLRIQFSSVTQSCPTLCDPMDCSMPGFPVHHELLELTQTHVRWVGDAIQPSSLLSSPYPPAFNHSQHQGFFKWVSSSHQVAKGLEFQLQHQSFQWIFRTDFL